MKKHSQLARLGFALAGLKLAWQREASFRTEVCVGSTVLLGFAWWQPPWYCWIVAIVVFAFGLSMELVNTAIEHVCDALHPNEHPLIKIAKDCASAAVLLANTTGLLVVLLLLLWAKKS